MSFTRERIMHIYSNEEYYEKQQNRIKEYLSKYLNKSYVSKKAPVIKDYIYYDEPVKIF